MVPDHEKLFPRWLRDRLSVILWLTANRRKCMITTPIPARIESLAWSSPMSARSSAGNVPTPQNLGRNCIFPWWMATPFWSRPVGAASMRAATSKLPWRITYENSAAIPARCWWKKSKIYQTRSNKLFCSERGVRLSGPPLGRRKASLTDAKIKRQMSKDSCERNAIEGRNGNAKRRFGLDRIFSKLDETAKTEAALILLAMNASLRLARWPAYFFRSLLLPFQFLCSLAGPNS